MKQFDYSVDFKTIDFREHPELYRVGKGEQRVLLVEPYKGEILPFWRFKTSKIARESSSKIYSLFLEYLAREDFVGADMARKFLQMGYTRSRRYANHKSGRKYRQNPQKLNALFYDSFRLAQQHDVGAIPLRWPLHHATCVIFNFEGFFAQVLELEKLAASYWRHR